VELFEREFPSTINPHRRRRRRRRRPCLTTNRLAAPILVPGGPDFSWRWCDFHPPRAATAATIVKSRRRSYCFESGLPRGCDGFVQRLWGPWKGRGVPISAIVASQRSVFLLMFSVRKVFWASRACRPVGNIFRGSAPGPQAFTVYHTK